MSTISDWIYKFYGHYRPFMPIGYRMRSLTLKNIGVFKNRNHEMHKISEMRIDYLQNGIMSLTGKILGKDNQSFSIS